MNFDFRHGAGHLGSCGLQHSGLTGDRNAGAGRGDRERHRQFEGGPDGKGHRARYVRESLLVKRNLVRPQLEIRESEPPFVVRGGGADLVCFGLTRAHLSGLDDSSGWICNASADAGIVDGFLRRGGRCPGGRAE